MSVEPAIPQHLRCPRTQASRMPAGFEAPYPAWMARFDEGARAAGHGLFRGPASWCHYRPRRWRRSRQC